MSEQELTITPAAEFRQMREEGVLVRLVSGRVVRLRTVTPDRLMQEGEIPDILTSLVLRMMYYEMDYQEILDFFKPAEKREKVAEILESLRVVCTCALLYPRIADQPQAEDEIAIDDLTLGERRGIFELVFLPAETLHKFRDQSPADVETVPDGEAEPQPAFNPA